MKKLLIGYPIITVFHWAAVVVVTGVDPVTLFSIPRITIEMWKYRLHSSFNEVKYLGLYAGLEEISRPLIFLAIKLSAAYVLGSALVWIVKRSKEI